MLMTPTCYTRKCKHYKGIIQPDGTEMTEVNFCDAFPKGIPNEIAYGTNKHLVPVENQDNDIVYEIGLFSWEEDATTDTDLLREIVWDLIKAGRWQKARLVAGQLTSIAPDDESTHVASGIVWLELNDLERAEHCFRRAVDVGGENVKNCLLMARVHAYRGDLKEQLHWALQAGQYDEDDPEPSFSAADAYIRLGQLRDAQGILSKLSHVQPDNIEAHRILGHVYLALQQLDEAANEFRTALRLQFDNAALWTDLGLYPVKEKQV